MQTIRVKAKEGTRCPREENARKYISDAPVDVPATPYYRRLLRDGSLVEVRDAKKPPPTVADTKKRQKEEGK